jgi:2-dehydro-3-deoxyphosphogluconate aldolase / (4S)-4-hydroxy-2-oxoglutarate aldolase
MARDQSRNDAARRLLQQRVIGIIRTRTPAEAEEQATNLISAGLRVIEITLTGEDMIGVIARLRREHSAVCVGAGTVLDAETGVACVRDGHAEFLVSPATVEDVVRVAHRYGRPAIVGAATPTEVLKALHLGADIVKVFPASALGVRWLRDVSAVFAHAVFVPTGGIGVDDVGDWLDAGATACGLGSQLSRGSASEVAARVSRLLSQVEAL